MTSENPVSPKRASGSSEQTNLASIDGFYRFRPIGARREHPHP